MINVNTFQQMETQVYSIPMLVRSLPSACDRRRYRCLRYLSAMYMQIRNYDVLQIPTQRKPEHVIYML
jgi:hypothetical protein